MPKGSHRKQGSFFYRIFWLAVITVFMVSTSCFILLNYVKGTLEKDKLLEQNAYIGACSNYMDNILKNLENIVTYIENDPQSEKALSGEKWQPDIFQSELWLISSLARFASLNEEVREIYLVPLEHEYVYTSMGTTAKKLFFDNRYRVPNGYEQWEELVATPRREMSFQKVERIEREKMQGRLNYPSGILLLKTLHKGARSVGTLIVTLEESLLTQLFSEQAFAAGRSIFLLDAENRVLMSNGEDSGDLLKNVEWDRLSSDEAGGAVGSYSSKLGLFSYQESAYSDARYLVYTPMEIVGGNVNRIFAVAYLILLALAVLMLGCAAVLSKQLYRPFRSIVDVLNSLTDHSDGLSDKKDELGFVKTRILDIVSVNHRLKNAMQDSSPAILEAVLFRIIFENAQSDDVLARTALYDIHLEDGFYNTFLIRLDLPTNSEENFYTQYAETFRKVVGNTIAEWLLSIIATRSDEYTVVTYCRSAEMEPSVLEEFRDLQGELLKLFPDSQIYIGCGQWVDHVFNLRTCYEQAIQAILQRSVNSTRVLLEPKEEASRLRILLPNDMELQLTTLLDAGIQEPIQRYIQNILEHCLKENVSTQSYLMTCSSINSFFTRYLQFSDTVLNDAILPIDPNSSFYSPKRLTEILTYNLTIVFRNLAHADAERAPIITRILEYVDENFNKDINLSTVADHLGYTPNYLSRYFKQVRGLNFTDYINRKKIDYAKMLLATENKSIKQVTLESGFNSAALFIKTFEKYEGLTPGEFKKLKNSC